MTLTRPAAGLLLAALCDLSAAPAGRPDDNKPPAPAAYDIVGTWEFKNKQGDAVMGLELTAKMTARETIFNKIMGANGLSMGKGGAYEYKDGRLLLYYEKPNGKRDLMLSGKVTLDKTNVNKFTLSGPYTGFYGAKFTDVALDAGR